MAPRIENYEEGLGELEQLLEKARREAKEAARHLSDADFQSTCNVLSHLAAYPLEQARQLALELLEAQELASELLKQFEADGVTAGRPPQSRST